VTDLPEWVRAALRCPACRATLDDVGTNGADTSEGEAAERADAVTALSCEGCGRVYPVRDGIPVLLVDEASGGRDDA
jgi:uncharacterized protein